ncbi:hypothetical protein B0T21DRAFT_413913 [Apiosordaria backusii]|uniref:Uncharacterized protein n=1 Tax=Apiosordaria backusii TaxID=314023 RepID=A0AA40E8R8_9PEZI|nr:hypothetical protein B0T21DRAFT_413913 [Apiosordaria backusii]
MSAATQPPKSACGLRPLEYFTSLQPKKEFTKADWLTMGNEINRKYPDNTVVSLLFVESLEPVGWQGFGCTTDELEEGGSIKKGLHKDDDVFATAMICGKWYQMSYNIFGDNKQARLDSIDFKVAQNAFLSSLFTVRQYMDHFVQKWDMILVEEPNSKKVVKNEMWWFRDFWFVLQMLLIFIVSSYELRVILNGDHPSSSGSSNSEIPAGRQTLPNTTKTTQVRTSTFLSFAISSVWLCILLYRATRPPRQQQPDPQEETTRELQQEWKRFKARLADRYGELYDMMGRVRAERSISVPDAGANFINEMQDSSFKELKEDQEDTFLGLIPSRLKQFMEEYENTHAEEVNKDREKHEGGQREDWQSWESKKLNFMTKGVPSEYWLKHA